MTKIECQQFDCKWYKLGSDEGTDYGICQRPKVCLKMWIMLDMGKGSKRGMECLHYEPKT